MPADFGEGHAVDADGLERFLDWLQLEWLNDGFDFLHRTLLCRRPRLRLEEVTFLAVQTHVHALDLRVLIHAHADQRVADLQNDPCAHDGQHPRHRDADQLVPDLPDVAVHPSERQRLAGGVLKTVVDQVGGEDAREDCAYGAARAVHAERIERIVITELALHYRDHEVAYDACDKSDKQRGKRLHKAG